MRVVALVTGSVVLVLLAGWFAAGVARTEGRRMALVIIAASIGLTAVVVGAVCLVVWGATGSLR